jgi:2-iminobutanoate/2-iminopropanoate deaminase
VDRRHTVTAPDAPKAIGPYSHAVRTAGELLFCSGQIPLDSVSGELVGESAGEQARRCLENLGAVCAAAGTSLERAVRVTIYMTDLERFAEVNEVCAELFPKDPPARVTVGVAALPRGAQVEIDAVVALGEDTSGELGLGGEASAAPGMSAAAGSGVPPGANAALGVGARPRASTALGASVAPGASVAAEASAAAGASVPPGASAALEASAAPPVSGPPPSPSPGQVYHLELRQFPHNLCRFNLGAEELYATVLAPWRADRLFELGELKWDPRRARLTVLEGPRLPPGQLTMGRGWSVARRQSNDVTAQLLVAE